MHNYAVRTTAAHRCTARLVADSRIAETSSPVRVRSGALNVRVKAKETFPSKVWRSWDNDEALIALSKNSAPWNSKKNLLMIQLRERGAVHGYLVLRFSNPVEDTAMVEETARNYAVALGLYLSLAHERGTSASRSITERIEPGSDQLTPRQISILRGMVEGKTNHELANELGFSVSTIRHETMRIYQALSVSDRKEAAKKALALALI